MAACAELTPCMEMLTAQGGGWGGGGEGPNLGSMPCPQPPFQPPRAIRHTLPAHHGNSPPLTCWGPTHLQKMGF